MTPEQAAEVLRYAALRDRRRSAIVDAARSIPQQYAALTDASTLKAYLCTRRSGKSYSIGLELFMTALDYPGCSCLYLGLTKDSAINIMNKDILAVLNDRFGTRAEWKDSKKYWLFPNGSIIYLRGADSNAYEIAKVVGQKYRLAVLDEAGKFRYSLHDMIYGSLLPAMGDDIGTIVLSGTPSNATAGLFYDATTGAKHGWSVHRWTWRDNVHKRDNIQVIHDKIVEDNPLVVTTPLYRQEWLGEWVVDQCSLVYRFDERLNTIPSLPRPASDYYYVLGVDLGFTDATAFTVSAFSRHDPTLYVVEAFKRSGLIISDVVDVIRGLWKFPEMGGSGVYPFTSMIADAASLQGVEEMRQRHHIPLESAKKAGKAGVIEVFNSDLRTGRIKLLPAAMDLAVEWGSLIWDEKKLAGVPRKYEEDPRFENHLSDSQLYGWRRARNYDATDAPPELPAVDSPAYGDALFQQAVAARDAQAGKRWPRAVQFDRSLGRRTIGRLAR